MKIQPKLMLLKAGTTLLTVAVAIGISLTLGSQALEKEIEERLRAVRDARHSEISEYLARIRRDAYLQGIDPKTVEIVQSFAEAFAKRGDKAQVQLQQTYLVDNPHAANERYWLSEVGDRSVYDRLHALYHPYLREKSQLKFWEDLLLVDRKGNVVYSVRKNPDFATNLINGPWRDSGLARAVRPLLEKPVYGIPAFADFSDYGPIGGRPAAFLAMPVFHPSEGLVGTVVIQLPTVRINTLMRQRSGLGESGENFLVGPGGWMLSDSRYDPGSSVLRKQLKTEAVDNVLKGRSDLIKAPDYRGVMSYIGLRHLQPFPDVIGGDVSWGIIAKMDRDEALAPLSVLRNSMLLAALLISLLSVAAAMFVARGVTRPILAIKQALTKLAKGQEVEVPCLERTDEIGSMAKAAETFREMARQTQHNHWVRENVARLTAAISAESSLRNAPDVLLKRFCDLLSVPMAAFYLNDGNGVYVRAGSHGLPAQHPLQDRFALGEGPVGQCAKDAQPLRLSPVPEGNGVVTTGLTEFPACELVLYPLQHKHEVLAVLELAPLEPLTLHQHELLAEACASLGLHLANLRAVDHNLMLLDESRKLTATLEAQQDELSQRNQVLQNMTEELRSQTEELKAQTEELKANQEELRAQQEEMAHKNQALEIQGLQLDAARKEAEAKAAELEQSSQYKSEFLANMSHELRTPLNSILILAKSLSENQEANLSPDQMESASVIHESGSHLLTLINDVLDLSKIEAGRLELYNEDYALDDVLAYLRRVFSPLAEKKHLDFVIEVDADLPETIHGDRQRITQVLTNLLSNAVKFTDAGEVRIIASRHQQYLQFDVSDSGIGIPADKIEHIFGVFQQLDGSTSRKYGGSGLGLAISRRLVELMGGRITVTSSPQEGSRFSVRIPLQPLAIPAQAPVPASSKVVSAGSSPRVRSIVPSGTLILVVEDDSRLVSILERLIDTLGYTVICVDSGEKALKEVAKRRPAGILLDLGLPGISGTEVLRQLKANPLTADIPVAIMSGSVDNGEAKALGAFTFLKKPVTRDVIAATLKAMNQQNSQLVRKRVLLVEDDPATVAALGRLFQHDPLDLVPVASGLAAFEQLESSQFDTVILDLGLPDMTGFEWLEALARKGEAHPPIIVYSARELDNEKLLALRGYTETVIIKGRHANERLHEEVLLAAHAPIDGSDGVTPHCSVTGHHLLLVDDDVRNLFALSKALRGRGYAVTVAESGERALEILRGGHFNAVLTDIMMPGIDGYELSQRIRELGYAELPIVAVTAKAMQGDRERCLKAGANAYVPKPVDLDRLVEILETLL